MSHNRREDARGIQALLTGDGVSKSFVVDDFTSTISPSQPTGFVNFITCHANFHFEASSFVLCELNCMHGEWNRSDFREHHTFHFNRNDRHLVECSSSVVFVVQNKLQYACCCTTPQQRNAHEGILKMSNSVPGLRVSVRIQ